MQKTVVDDEVQVQEDINQSVYSKANLKEMVTKLHHLEADQHSKLLEMLKEYDLAFCWYQRKMGRQRNKPRTQGQCQALFW